MKNKKIYAFIFARGNSIRLKNKNLQKIEGKTLVEHSINIAKKVKKISKIFVSSDSKKILNLAKRNKVNYILRPKKLCSSNSKEIYSWRHAINVLKKNNDNFDIFLSLPPTSPLRLVKDINNLIKKFEKSKSDIIITVSQTNRYPFFNMVLLRNKGSAKLAARKRKVNLNKFYEISTVGYISSPKYILKTNNYFSGKVGSLIIPRDRAIDIDDEFDLKLAKILIKQNEK